MGVPAAPAPGCDSFLVGWTSQACMLLFIELLCKHGVVALCQPWLNDSVVCCGGASWVTVTTVSAPGGKQHTQRQQRDHLAVKPGNSLLHHLQTGGVPVLPQIQHICSSVKVHVNSQSSSSPQAFT
jgi:hypothetical protein